jgi:hypothetical protein
MLSRVELFRVYGSLIWNYVKENCVSVSVCVCVCVCVPLFGKIRNTYGTVGLKQIDYLKDQGLDGLVILKLFIKTQENV